MLKVTGFTPSTDIGNGRKGLHGSARTISRASIAGEDFSNGFTVVVKFTAKNNPSANSRYWTGLLAQDEVGTGFHADMECMIGTPPDIGNEAVQVGEGVGGGGGDDLTVTVGNSPAYTPPTGTVPIGT